MGRLEATMRDEDRRLFPLSTIGSVVQLFRHQLTREQEPDITLLSIVAGCVENSMTCPRSSSVPEGLGENCHKVEEFQEPEVADVENLRIEPVVESHIVEALYAKFQAMMRGYCDLSQYQEVGQKTASRGLVKRVSDIIWNTLTKSQYKDRAHLQSIYSYMTESKLDCFGVAMAVVAGCQVLGFSDVHLALSEDHAWVVLGEDGTQTAEVTWHGKGNEDRRGLPVDPDKARDSWSYVGGCSVLCSRHMEVAALVSSISPAISPTMDCLEVGVVQQELLWLLYDPGHLERYPMALGNLGDLEEISPTPGRQSSQELYHEAVRVSRGEYRDQHVYPYTYLVGFHYRQRDFKGALRSWADAANVIKRYKYSKDDEEIYKEFMEINNELIPHILKADENLVRDPQCFGSLLQFYDGLCSWEEDSCTPVLHIGWVKPIVKSFGAFDYSVRSKLDITFIEDEGKDDLLSLSDSWTLSGEIVRQLSCTVPDTINNNYTESETRCDNHCDENPGHYDISLYRDNTSCYIYQGVKYNSSFRLQSTPRHGSFQDFDGMNVNQLLRFALSRETEFEGLEEANSHHQSIEIPSATKDKLLS